MKKSVKIKTTLMMTRKWPAKPEIPDQTIKLRVQNQIYQTKSTAATKYLIEALPVQNTTVMPSFVVLTYPF